MLYHRNVRGLLLFQSARNQGTLDFEWRHFSVVLCGPSLRPHPGHLVTYNGFLHARMAWQILARGGRRRIGLIIADVQMSHSDATMIGACLFEAWHSPFESPIPPLYIHPHDGDSIRRWFAEHRPDGVIGMHDGLYWELTRMGIQIPDDCAYISLHSENRYAQVAGFAVFEERLAEVAIEVLDRHIRSGERGLPVRPFITTVETEWVPGLSCPHPCLDSPLN
jgi:DNA-binding LacI/PurR family transcriptional regulator